MARREADGTAIREIRTDQGITQPELARRSGISQPHLSNIERNARPASPYVLRRIARVLEVPIEEITSAPREPVAS